MKKSFLLYIDQSKLVNKLSDEQAGKLLKSFYNFNSDEPIELDETLSLIFIPFEQTFIRDGEKYDKKVEANRRNGILGGRPKTQTNPDEPKKPSGLFRNPNNLDRDRDRAVNSNPSLNSPETENKNTGAGRLGTETKRLLFAELSKRKGNYGR